MDTRTETTNRADLLREEIAHHEEWMRENGHLLPCGAQDRVTEQIDEMRAEVDEIERCALATAFRNLRDADDAFHAARDLALSTYSAFRQQVDGAPTWARVADALRDAATVAQAIDTADRIVDSSSEESPFDGVDLFRHASLTDRFRAAERVLSATLSNV